ncbi:MAG: hypothetical protein V4528_10160 [Pseudomonadota bacterium]
METKPRVLIIAGPNGTGKTTFAPAVDFWVLYDNAGERPVLLDWSEKT